MKEKQSKTNDQFEFQSFGKDVLIYSLGNGLLLVFGFIQVLIIPRYLSVEGYGYWQLFLLYSSFVGILHLGFIDGVLVRWAGRELAQISGEIKIAFRFLIVEQVVVVAPLGLLLYFLLPSPFQWICLMILAFAFVTNLAGFFMFTLQAVRKFRLLTAAYVGRGATFLILIILLFAMGYSKYIYVVYAFLVTLLLTLPAFAFWFRQHLWGQQPVTHQLWAYGRENINIGIFVLLGNFVLVLFLAIDRLIVSSFFTIDQFAIYAFALAVAVVAYALIRAVSEVFFPYLSGAEPRVRTQVYRLGKPAIVLTWAAILAIYFPLSRLVESYLPHYVASLPIMQILLCTVGFGGVIQVLHVNYYKVYRKQRQYFIWGVMALALSAVLNLLAIKVWGTLESVAIATLSSFGIWYTVNELSLRSVVGGNGRELGKGIVVLGSYLGAFWIASLLTGWFVAQMLIYICLFFLITWFFLRHEVKELVALASEVRGQRR